MKDILLHFLSFSFLRLVFFFYILISSFLESDFDNDDDYRYKFVTFSAIFLLNSIVSFFSHHHRKLKQIIVFFHSLLNKNIFNLCFMSKS